MKKIVYFIPSFIILFLIFGFSSQNGQESGQLSSAIYYYIQRYITLPFSKEMMTFFIRKAAHMTEFGLLAISLLWGFKHTLNHHIYTITFLLTVIFAALDEYHQTFVSGRAGQVIDVLIDSSGAFIFLILVYILTNLIKKKRVG